MIKSVGHHSIERNPFARFLFQKLGLDLGLAAVMFVYVLILSVWVVLYSHSEGLMRSIEASMFLVSAVFVSVVQLQAAWFNTTGVMIQPLRVVVKISGRFYR